MAHGLWSFVFYHSSVANGEFRSEKWDPAKKNVGGSSPVVVTVSLLDTLSFYQIYQKLAILLLRYSYGWRKLPSRYSHQLYHHATNATNYSWFHPHMDKHHTCKRCTPLKFR